MTIIRKCLFTIKDYLKFVENNVAHGSCPCCGRRLRKHGKFNRTVHFRQRSYEIPILRRRCPDCRKTFSLKPCFIVPWGRFANHIFEFLLRWISSGTSTTSLAHLLTTHTVSFVSLKTLYRWKAKYFRLFFKWREGVRRMLVESFHEGDGFLTLYRRGMNSEEEIRFLLHFYFTGESIPRIGRIFSAIFFRQTLAW